MTKTLPTVLALATLLVVPLFAFADNSNTSNPSCWISADPAYVVYGGSTTLRFDSDNADEGWINEVGDVEVDGDSEVVSNITKDTTYTFTVKNDDERATCSVRVYVIGQTHSYNQPYCTISMTYNGGYSYNQTASLRWTTYNAEHATISSIGDVGLNGAYTVTYPFKSHYTMTVTGDDGTATCSTLQSYYPQYTQPYYTAPYVSLTQIPYTGFGDTASIVLFFATTLLFALAGGYLVVYYGGGMLRPSFGGEVTTAARNQIKIVRRVIGL